MPITGAAGRDGEVHHLADLLGERFAERAAEHGEILREEKDLAAVDGRASGDDAVAEKLLLVQPERGGAVHHELSSSVNEPSSTSASMRSRAVRFPRARCFSFVPGPAGSRACVRFSSRA